MSDTIEVRAGGGSAKRLRRSAEEKRRIVEATTRRGSVAEAISRVQLLQFTANLKVKLIGMEACGGSHFLGRALREQGSANP